MSFWEERKKRKEEGVDLSEDYKRALDELAGFTPEEFSYDADTDPMYQQYHDKYERSARAAMEESLTKANARSGGWGNSYAEVAAQQAYNTQMEGVTDIIPELHELAYGRHQTEQAQKKQALADKVTYAKAAYDLDEAERTEALARAYLDVSNRVNEGTLTADGLDAYLTENYDGMTPEDVDELKAELYGGGVIKTKDELDAEVEATAPAKNTTVPYVTPEGETVEISQAEVDEVYNYLRTVAAGYTDDEGNTVEGSDPVASRKTLEMDLARMKDENGDRLYSDEAIAAAFDDFEDYVATAEAQAQENNADLLNSAMTYVIDGTGRFDPASLGIDAEAWEGMDDEMRKDAVLTAAETMTKGGQISKSDFAKVAEQSVVDNLSDCLSNEDENDTLDVIPAIVENVQAWYEEGVIEKDDGIGILKRVAVRLDGAGYLGKYIDNRGMYSYQVTMNGKRALAYDYIKACNALAELMGYEGIPLNIIGSYSILAPDETSYQKQQREKKEKKEQADTWKHKQIMGLP